MSRILVLLINSSDYWKMLVCGSEFTHITMGCCFKTLFEMNKIKQVSKFNRTLIKYHVKCHQCIMNCIAWIAYECLVQAANWAIPKSEYWISFESRYFELWVAKVNWLCSGSGSCTCIKYFRSWCFFFHPISLND